MILRKKTKRGKRLKAPQKRKISLKSVFVRHFGAPLNTFLPLRVLLKKYPLPSLTPPPPNFVGVPFVAKFISPTPYLPATLSPPGILWRANSEN